MGKVGWVIETSSSPPSLIIPTLRLQHKSPYSGEGWAQKGICGESPPLQLSPWG